MGKPFFRKQNNKPLLALSLILSLTLHLTGLYILFKCPSLLFSAVPLSSKNTSVDEKQDIDPSFTEFFNQIALDEGGEEPLSETSQGDGEEKSAHSNEKTVNQDRSLRSLFLPFKDRKKAKSAPQKTPSFSPYRTTSLSEKESPSSKSDNVKVEESLEVENTDKDILNILKNSYSLIKKPLPTNSQEQETLDLLNVKDRVKLPSPFLLANQPLKNFPEPEKKCKKIFPSFSKPSQTSAQLPLNIHSTFFPGLEESKANEPFLKKLIQKKSVFTQHSKILVSLLNSSNPPIQTQGEKTFSKQSPPPCKEENTPLIKKAFLVKSKSLGFITFPKKHLDFPFSNKMKVLVDRKGITASKPIFPYQDIHFEIERVGPFLTSNTSDTFFDRSSLYEPSHQNIFKKHLGPQSIKSVISLSPSYENIYSFSKPFTCLKHTPSSLSPVLHPQKLSAPIFIANSGLAMHPLPYIDSSFSSSCKETLSPFSHPQKQTQTQQNPTCQIAASTSLFDPFSLGATRALALKTDEFLIPLNEGRVVTNKLYVKGDSISFQSIETPPFNPLIRAPQILEIPHLVLKDLFITKEFLIGFSAYPNTMHKKAVFPTPLDIVQIKPNYPPPSLLSDTPMTLLSLAPKKSLTLFSFEETLSKPSFFTDAFEEGSALTFNDKVQPQTPAYWDKPFQKQTLHPLISNQKPSDLLTISDNPQEEIYNYLPPRSIEIGVIATESLSQDREFKIAEHEQKTLTKHFSAAFTLVENAPSSIGEEKRLQIAEKHLSRYDLNAIPKPDTLPSLQHTEKFETAVKYNKRQDGEGYFFEITLQPKNEVHFNTRKQNFLFIVDGSSSIEQKRYQAFKDGAKYSLKYLKEGDSFNILLVDSTIEAYQEKPIAWSPLAVKEAKRYLDHQKYNKFFSLKNPFNLLKELSPYFDSEKENIILFMSDGHSLDCINRRMEEFAALAKESQGQFSIFTASCSEGNNFPMLDLVSTFNGGEMMYSQTNIAFPRKLAIFVKHIENFVAGDMRVHAMDSTTSKVEFYPNPKTLPSLYSDRPYRIYGIAQNLDDFNLMLQGRSGNEYISIRKTISFKDAKKGGKSLERNFAHQQAYVCYDYYLKYNDPFFLLEAERLLTPHAIPLAAVR